MHYLQNKTLIAKSREKYRFLVVAAGPAAKIERLKCLHPSKCNPKLILAASLANHLNNQLLFTSMHSACCRD
jgi:hypothetical protein